MDEKQIEEILKRAIETLFVNQPDIYEFTPETRQTEWNLAHHLANEIHPLFPELSCDLEVSKPNLENRRPDIILHRRGIQDHNFLVVEVKRDGIEEEIRSDIEKIRTYWFGQPLRYQFGAVVNLKSDKSWHVQVLSN